MPISIALVSAFTLAWAGNPQNPYTTSTQVRDTVPTKKNENARRPSDKDLDKELRELDEARKSLNEIKDKDWDKIQRDVEEAIEKIDFQKIGREVEESIRKVDMEKIGKEIEDAISKIDFKKIEQDVEAALNEVSKIDREKIRQDIQKVGKDLEEQLEKKEWRKEIEEMKKIDMEKIKMDMEKARKEVLRVKEDLKREKLSMKETMQNAGIGIEKAKEELKGYQEMIYSMEQDGLLSTKDDYSIEYKKGELSINGKKQSGAITDKYKKYFKNDAITIKKVDGDIKINMDNTKIDMD